MQRRIAIANRKGGCGKTVSAVNISAGLCLKGKKVLLIDCDAQAHATISLGFSPYEIEKSLYDLFIGTYNDINEIIYEAAWPQGLFIAPATGQLAAFELESSSDLKARGLLAQHILSQEASKFDYIIFDPPPTVGLLMLMCLAAAKEVIIPVQTHFLNIEGLAEMVRFIYQINATINPDLRITGIIPTLYSQNTKLSKNVLDEIIKNFSEEMVFPPVRQNVAIAEAPAFGMSIFEYSPNSIGALDYNAVVDRIDNFGGILP
ncbi:MAG: ParA family protein [Desulfobacterales bacterium]|nr:ParA family protein [Desulfobacterales bacterium]